MALTFVKRASPGAKRKVRIPRKSLLLAQPERRIIVQEYAAIDQFGDLPARKRHAAQEARKLGHDLLPWHRRSNDPAGRWNAFCASCNLLAVVCTEAPDGLQEVYGKALTQECKVVTAD